MADAATWFLSVLMLLAAAVTIGFGFCAYHTDGRCATSPLHLAGGLAMAAVAAFAFAHARLGVGTRRAAQAALGLAALLYTLLLVTGFVWWLAANLAYAVLALAAAGVPARTGRALAGAGLAVFAAVNGAIVAMGGAFLVAGAFVLLVLPQALLLRPGGERLSNNLETLAGEP